MGPWKISGFFGLFELITKSMERVPFVRSQVESTDVEVSEVDAHEFSQTIFIFSCVKIRSLLS